MRSSELFTKTRKQLPADETAKNARLLIQAGFIYKEMAGVYDYLPMGLRVLENIARIVREEMNAIGGQEIKLTALQSKELWERTDRWDDKNVDIWFKTKLASGTDIGLGWTQEEPLTNLLTDYINSYKDLPVSIYQIQNKFRNELRAKSGIFRGREFLMKDMYSFSRSQAEHDKIYAKVRQSYFKIYKRLGLGDKTYLTFASGGAFAKYSDEFQTISESGEDTIYLDKSKKTAVNDEVYNAETLKELGLKKDDLEKVKAIEVGNIFSLGTKFSKPLGLEFTDEKGHRQPVVMGCYGIGISRSMGTIAEVLSDDKGLVWPEEVAPFIATIISLGDSQAVQKAAGKLYQDLTTAGIEVIYDDRDLRAGEKFADADLTGVPYRIVVSDSTTTKQKFEFKSRTSEDIHMLDTNSIVSRLTKAS